jgi:hypothetical protein
VFVRRVKLRLIFWELTAADLSIEEIGAEVRVITTEKIRKAGLSIRVVKRFEVKV